MPVVTLLTHLNLIKEDGALANAAILLFGKNPQKYFINSEVKCAQFYGCEVEKPMADHQIYAGDVFDLADQATRFVMTHISRSIGRHDGETGSAPTTYELPYDAVFELIVNAICHRDYTSHESVQIMLFKDRLEIWNAGALPRGWTVKDLYKPHPCCLRSSPRGRTSEQSSTVVTLTMLRKKALAGLIRRIGPDKGGHWEVVS